MSYTISEMADVVGKIVYAQHDEIYVCSVCIDEETDKQHHCVSGGLCECCLEALTYAPQAGQIILQLLLEVLSLKEQLALRSPA